MLWHFFTRAISLALVKKVAQTSPMLFLYLSSSISLSTSVALFPPELYLSSSGEFGCIFSPELFIYLSSFISIKDQAHRVKPLAVKGGISELKRRPSTSCQAPGREGGNLRATQLNY